MTAANLPREARALLDAIAVGESDPMARHEGISPYFILYDGGSFEGYPELTGYNNFPEWAGKDNSHAAGRYQFQPATWKVIVPRFGQVAIPDFRNPGDQDWGAWFLAQSDYRARAGAPLLNALRAGDIGDIGGVLHPTWTSLSDDTFPDRYTAALATYPVDRPMPAPKPTPEVPVPPVILPPPTAPTQGFHTKFTAGMLGSSLALIVITELNRRGITIDGNEGAAITMLVSGLLTWLAPSLPSD